MYLLIILFFIIFFMYLYNNILYVSFNYSILDSILYVFCVKLIQYVFCILCQINTINSIIKNLK